MLAMPYRRVASSVTRDLPGLVAAVKQYAPSVRIIEGPALTYDLVWRPGADSTPPDCWGGLPRSAGQAERPAGALAGQVCGS